MLRAPQAALHVDNQLGGPNFLFPVCKYPSTLALGPEWARGLPAVRALGCSPSFFLNKSFLGMKHLVNIIYSQQILSSPERCEFPGAVTNSGWVA